jgi:uncharacterized repeat protein (TIGR01451 family)
MATHTHAHLLVRQSRLVGPRKDKLRIALALLLAAQWPAAQAATIQVNSTAADRGSFSELQCLPSGSDVDAGPTQTTVTGGATLTAAMADGGVTLREAICVANNTPEADVITLQPATYTLSTADNYWYGPNGLPPIGDHITIEGNGAVIRRNPANTDALSQRFRFFFVSRKTLTHGIAIVGGADRARLTLRDLVLRGGLAQGGQSMAGGGGGGMGGAIFNQGELDLQRVTLDGNTARGGASGATPPIPLLASFVWSGLGGGMGANGPLLSLPAGEGSGFGPGLFGGGLGGASLVDGANSACGGGAGFGVSAGGGAVSVPGTGIVGGNGGGLGNVGGSAVLLGENSGVGRDGGGGAGLSFGGLAVPDSAHGDGRGGAFGQRGNPATTCGGGGGVGSAGGVYRLESGGGMGGHGGFGGGGSGVVLVGPSLPSRTSFYLGGSGGFGGGGAASEFGSGVGGFGGGYGDALGVGPSSNPGGGGGAGLGGALFNHGGEVTASNTTWTANRALGGAVGNADLGVLSSAQSGWGMGGAIFNLDGSLTLIQSTLASNRASAGVAVVGASAVTGQAAGGALYHRVQNPNVYGFAPQVSIRGSILADSVDAAGNTISDCNHSAHPDATVGSALNEASFSIFETLAGLPFGAGSGETSTPACAMTTASTLADPQLLPLADNGGLTPTMEIPFASPARNAAGACALPTDQRGLARPQGPACDAGAFEREFECVPAGVRRVNAQAAAGGNGSSWGTAMSNLQDALADPAACEVWVAAGVYKPTSTASDRLARFTMRNVLGVYGGFAGTETARNQRNHRINVTVLSGDIDNNDIADLNGVVRSADAAAGANSFRVVEASSVNDSAVLDGFTITAGMANGSGANTFAGGMRASGGLPTLRNLDFVGNRATFAGGGLLSNSNLVLTHIRFRGNAGGDGGGLFNDSASPTLTNVEFTDNSGNRGAGMMNFGGSPVLTNVSFSGNTATGSGGAIRNALNAPALAVRNTVMWNNRDASGTGTLAASISNESGSVANFSASLVQGCKPGGNWLAPCGTDGGGNLADSDPLFVATTGGNFRLSDYSPAIDAGNNSLIPSGVTTDLDGNPRRYNDTGVTDTGTGTAPIVDLGAYEKQSNSVQTTTTTIVSDLPDPSVTGQSYVVSVQVAGQIGPPTGSVNVGDGTDSCVVILAAAASPNSAGSCNLTSTTAGTKTLTATYVPASAAFAASATTSTHQVNAAATTLSLSGPSSSALNQPASYTATLSVSTPGAGTPTGTISVQAGAQSCVITLPASSCAINWNNLGPRDVTASYAPANGNFLTSSSGLVNTLVFARADLSVNKSNGVVSYLPNDLLVYTITVRNAGPDPALQIRLLDPVPGALGNVAWACVASGGAVCPAAGGVGSINAQFPSLPVNAQLVYTLSGSVIGSPASISNTATLQLPSDGTVLATTPANLTSTDLDLFDRFLQTGFEDPQVNRGSGRFVLPSQALRGVLEQTAVPVYALDDHRGDALRVYARMLGGQLEYALALRNANGSWSLGAWRSYPGEPELRWSASLVGTEWRLTAASVQ